MVLALPSVPDAPYPRAGHLERMKHVDHAAIEGTGSDSRDVESMERALGIAILGGGKMAQQHAEAVARAGVRASVVAFAEPEPAASEVMQGLCPSAVAFSGLTDLLRAVSPHVVHVCTPPTTHESLAEEALLGGCHVYVEKPFASTERGAARLLELAERHGLRAMAGHQLIFERPFQRLLSYLPSLRRLVHVESYFSFRHNRHGKLLRPDEQLSDILPHSVGLLVETLRAGWSGERVELTRIEAGAGGTIHALVRCGDLTATLIITLQGRPVESYLRVVGTNGSVVADFVRGTVQESIGPGASGVDKVLQPYRAAWQLGVGTTAALSRRALKREISYPGLRAALEAFYRSVTAGPGASTPLSYQHILDTVAICEAIDAAVNRPRSSPPPTSDSCDGPRVAVTGGTGLLGRATLVELLRRGAAPLSLSRRQPSPWEGLTGVDYAAYDISRPLPPNLFEGVDVVVHCAAATAGGWEEHKRHSVDATEHVLRAAAAAGVRRVVHVSSIAVLARPRRGQSLNETSPLVADAASAGPYVYGKLVSEQLARDLAAELGVELRIVRPGAIVDWNSFEPPGRLGTRVGNWFVAVGRPREGMGVVDVEFAAEALAWMALADDGAPDLLNLIAPIPPTRRALVERLRRDNPTVRVVWAPRAVIILALNAAGRLKRLIRSGGDGGRLAAGEVFGHRAWDTALIAGLEDRMRRPSAERERATPPTAPA
jgi:predicted dehydrogenase/nucleoside-diphosphate-sugar epimerase